MTLGRTIYGKDCCCYECLCTPADSLYMLVANVDEADGQANDWSTDDAVIRASMHKVAGEWVGAFTANGWGYSLTMRCLPRPGNPAQHDYQLKVDWSDDGGHSGTVNIEQVGGPSSNCHCIEFFGLPGPFDGLYGPNILLSDTPMYHVAVPGCDKCCRATTDQFCVHVTGVLSDFGDCPEDYISGCGDVDTTWLSLDAHFTVAWDGAGWESTTSEAVALCDDGDGTHFLYLTARLTCTSDGCAGTTLGDSMSVSVSIDGYPLRWTCAGGLTSCYPLAISQTLTFENIPPGGVNPEGICPPYTSMTIAVSEGPCGMMGPFPGGTPASPAHRHSVPCVHLGAGTGETVLCPACRGTVRVKTFGCAKHGTCTTHKSVPDRACCLTCPDYQSPGE